MYQRMVRDLEAVIAASYDMIHLDNKFEFLVCAEICGFQTSLEERIHAEAARSCSPSGTFLVDRHNQHGQLAKSDLISSEHRNVLYIMSTRTFTPMA